MKTELLIDIALDTASSCNLRRINACCINATKIGAAALGEGAEIALANLTFSCPGYDRNLGCQAHITGELLDPNGVLVMDVDTTAGELSAYHGRL